MGDRVGGAAALETVGSGWGGELVLVGVDFGVGVTVDNGCVVGVRVGLAVLVGVSTTSWVLQPGSTKTKTMMIQTGNR